MKRFLFPVAIAGLAINVVSFACSSDDDSSSDNCSSTVGKMYQEGCELWCDDTDDWYSCSWWNDNDPSNLSEFEAVDVCHEMEDDAEEEGCQPEFEDVLECLLSEIGQDNGPGGDYDDLCVENCESEVDDLFACVFSSSSGADNVGACEDWLASMECGDYDFSELVDCSIYSDTPCDISDYFDCLAENGSCDEDTGVYDSSGWADCADLASCD
jgi:hypothetical protein